METRLFRPKTNSWGTANELAFVAKLGTGAFCDPRMVEYATRLDRHTLLGRYLAAMPLRQTWGDIDEGKVRQAVMEALIEVPEKILRTMEP